MTPDIATRRTQRRAGHCVCHTNAGFSLLELLIVVSLIFVLFTMYFSRGSRGHQLKQMAACQRNLENIFVALKKYSLDNNDRFPAVTGATTSEGPLSLLVPRCTTGTEYFICPGSKDAKLPDAKPFADGRISYAYYMGHTVKEGGDQPLMSDRQVNTNSKLAGEPVFSNSGKKPGNNHDKYGGMVMFCEGTVRSSAPFASMPLTNAANIILLNPRP